MNLIELFGRLLGYKKPCDHRQNCTTRCWLSADGTPMVTTNCHNCGWKDEGHVYGDSKNWIKTIKVAEGKVIEK